LKIMVLRLLTEKSLNTKVKTVESKHKALDGHVTIKGFVLFETATECRTHVNHAFT